MTLFIILILICELLLISFAAYIFISFINKTPFYPSSLKKLNELRDSGLIDLSKYNSFIDIGSGDGRIVRWADKHGFKQSSGIDYNPYLTLYSKLRSFPNTKIKIYNKNFNNHTFEEYDVAYMYIFSEHMDTIMGKLLKEMKSGSIIITNTFKFTNLEPDIVYKNFRVYKVK